MATSQFCEQNSENFFGGLKIIPPALGKIRDSYLNIFEFQDTLVCRGQFLRLREAWISNLILLLSLKPSELAVWMPSYFIQTCQNDLLHNLPTPDVFPKCQLSHTD